MFFGDVHDSYQYSDLFNPIRSGMSNQCWAWHCTNRLKTLLSDDWGTHLMSEQTVYRITQWNGLHRCRITQVSLYLHKRHLKLEVRPSAFTIKKNFSDLHEAGRQWSLCQPCSQTSPGNLPEHDTFPEKKIVEDTYGSWIQFRSNSHWSVEQIKCPKFMCVWLGL